MKRAGYFCDKCGKIFEKDKLYITKEHWESYVPEDGVFSGTTVKNFCSVCLDDFLTKKSCEFSGGTKIGYVKAYNKYVYEDKTSALTIFKTALVCFLGIACLVIGLLIGGTP